MSAQIDLHRRAVASILHGIGLSLLLLLGASNLLAQDQVFEKASALYQNGKYQKALEQFQTLAEAAETPVLHYNLALTELRLEQPAAARWHIERALLLDPLNSKYRQTRTHILDTLQLTEGSPALLETAAQLLSFRDWLWLSALSFWLTLALWLLPRWWSGRAPSLGIKIWRGILILVLLCSLTALWIQQRVLQAGIIIQDTPVSLRSAPASAAPECGVVQPGERLQVIGQHQQFYQVRTRSQLEGWASERDFRPLQRSAP